MAQPKQILWQTGTINVLFLAESDGVVRLSNIQPHDAPAPTPKTSPFGDGSVSLF
jgi:hypothetical protein